MNNYPIYNIQRFHNNTTQNDLYINTFHQHLLAHNFIENSHSHNFYLLVVFTQGTGKHKIDNNTFEIKKGSLFLIQPGQVHSWSLSSDIDGYIVFYTKEIYDLYFGSKKIETFPFYHPQHHISELQLDETELHKISLYFELLVAENRQNFTKKKDKLLNLIDCIHIEIARKQLLENTNQQSNYLDKMKTFNTILNQYYKTQKAPSFYADKMFMSLKHLNRICKNTHNKTVTELIAQRVILESKRQLTFTSTPINQIATDLGYINLSYFTKLFKKYTQTTPNGFRKEIKKEDW